MIVVNNIRGSIEGQPSELYEKAAGIAGLPPSQADKAFVYRRAVDARRNIPVFVYSIGFPVDKEIAENPDVSVVNEYVLPQVSGSHSLNARPVVVGFGPAGMFCAYVLAKLGYRPIVLERGACLAQRHEKVKRFFESGLLDENTNVQFGEGGAGAYSDGKLTTRIKDTRCRYVLERLVEFGAPEQILMLAKPHIGTDKLGGVVTSLRLEIERMGGQVIFEAPLTQIDIQAGKVVGLYAGDQRIEVECLVLATGHSARDVYRLLGDKGIELVPKSFSMGVRIEHLQKDIDEAYYKDYAGHPALGAADYALSYRQGERGVYSFCMCPGGSIIPAASEAGGVVCNGMSEYARAGRNGNSALCVSVNPDDFANHPFGGMELQRSLERAAFHAAGGDYSLPVQLVGDYLNGRHSTKFGRITPCNAGHTAFCNLSELLPGYIDEYLKIGIKQFARQAAFFGQTDAVLTGVETRTSAPIRIQRNGDCMVQGVFGIFPCGEGAGYAGGIMSAAVDGIAVAESIAGIFNRGGI